MGILKSSVAVVLLSLLFYLARGSPNTMDGFNMYKDLLRGKNEEFNEIGDDDGGLTRVTYFYRTPAAAYPEYIGETFGKRGNTFKNYMLNRDGAEGIDDVVSAASKIYFPRTIPKRGALLSWAIPAANRVRIVNTSYRPPGINRPAAAE
ncbi:uncharacterized protein DMENIID0001_120740 [Sergentomyia squamirostris]